MKKLLKTLYKCKKVFEAQQGEYKVFKDTVIYDMDNNLQDTIGKYQKLIDEIGERIKDEQD